MILFLKTDFCLVLHPVNARRMPKSEKTQLLTFMTVFRRILFFVLIFGTFHGTGQNLILDPGFEHVKQWKWEIAGLEECLYMWSNPNESTADYFHPNASMPSFKVPENVYGYQEPHSGKAYAGFCVAESHLEFLQTEFDENLIKDQLYCVQLYVSKAEKTPGMLDAIGIYFAPSFEFQYSKSGLGRRADMHLSIEHPEDTQNWQLLCGLYRAQGWERAFIVGAYEEYHQRHAHYYVDDISMTAVQSNTDCGCDVVDIQVGFRRVLNKWYVLENCYFDFDSSVLTEEAISEIEVLKTYLSEHGNTKILIKGHTDVRGKEGYNEKLSVARAQSVKNKLVEFGIDESRIKTRGMGKSTLADKGTSEESHAMNRRVSYILYQPNP